MIIREYKKCIRPVQVNCDERSNKMMSGKWFFVDL